MNSFSLSVLGLSSKHMVSSSPCPTVSTSWQLDPHYRPQIPPFLSVSPGPPLAHNTRLSPEAVQAFPAGLPASAMDPIGAFSTQWPCHLLHGTSRVTCLRDVHFSACHMEQKADCFPWPRGRPLPVPCPVCPVPILALASCPDHTPRLEIASVSPRRGLHLWPPLPLHSHVVCFLVFFLYNE